MLKDKILAQLVAKFPGVSKKFLGLWADKLAAKVTEESGIQGAVDELDNLPIPLTELATEFQREGDRRVTEAEQARKKPNPPAKKPGKTEDDPEEPAPSNSNDEAPAWAKSLMEDVRAMKAEKVQGTMKTKAADLLKDVPEKFYAGRALPEKEEDLQAFVDTVKGDYTTFKQELVNQGLMSATPPAGAGEPAKLKDSTFDAVIDGWVKSKEEPKS